MQLKILSLLLSLPLVRAWLPSDKHLFGNFTTDTSNYTISAGNGRSLKRWLPATGKIRGVNLGSMFVIEPWMASTEWADMGCGNAASEFDCVSALGQAAANVAFQAHWNRWITENDIATMASYGINTIRIPVGYWIDESIVYEDSEHFPEGGLGYLERICGWASNYGFYIIIDLHGAPGAQVRQQPFTGQNAPTDGFYQTYQYERAYGFLDFITRIIHTNQAYRNVGMVGVVNEPVPGYPTLITEYYPNAYNTIRNAESSLGITANNYLHIQYMDTNWGSGNPIANMPSTYFVAFDNHRYVKYDSSVPPNKAAYLATSCHDNPASDGQRPVIVGEWSISPSTDYEWSPEFDPSITENRAWYRKWWAAQVMTYERELGWIFWAWKAQLGDYRWSYSEAVAAGVIPRNPDLAYSSGAC